MTLSNEQSINFENIERDNIVNSTKVSSSLDLVQKLGFPHS